MSAAIFHKLLAIFATVALGWLAGRARWLGRIEDGSDPARVLSNAAFTIFIPALLFRTVARLDLGALPWATLIAFFAPVLLLLGALYGWQRHANREHRLPAAAPSVRAITVGYGNTVQIGIPVALALFGEAGLGVHMMIVSVHALVLLTVLTALAELDLARERARVDAAASLAQTLGATLRNTLIHPVLLPVLAGIAWHATGWLLPAPLDETLALLGSAVVPLCLVLIGLSLATYDVRGSVRQALALSAAKLLLLPALVLLFAHAVSGLRGIALAVVVMAAALPAGSNALIFSQRYRALQAEVSAAIVFSTLGYALTAPLWLLVLRWLGAVPDGTIAPP